MDKATGKGRRALEYHTSTTDNTAIRAEGKIMKDNNGREIRIHADQLEVSPGGQWLYYQPASGPLWRVETRYLNDAGMEEKELQEKVTLFYKTPSTGGTAIDADGNLYVSDVDQQQIIRISPEGKAKTILKDDRVAWCDALWIDEKGYLWMPTGQLNRLASFQGGISRVQFPLVIYKLQIGVSPFKS